jgi:hypothetical protein
VCDLVLRVDGAADAVVAVGVDADRPLEALCRRVTDRRLDQKRRIRLLQRVIHEP